MKFSYAWLGELVDLGALTPEALAELLTMAGLEVEAVEPLGPTLDGVVVGHVRTTRPHPNADRLTLCDVDLGDGATVQIVCGAPNVAAGQKVPVATVGTTLHLRSRKDPSVREAVTLGRATIRGEVSHGMICSEDELGLSDAHDGILVLEADAPVGQPLAAYLAARGRLRREAVLDVAITPNRPDATCHVGVARDVAALTGRAVRLPEVPLPAPGGAAAEAVTVRIEDPAACRRYVGLVVRGVRVGPSPTWVQERLRAVGLRPINNVVDATNLVMLEVGQPLHAFDLARLAGEAGREATIVVRRARAGERIVTLDDQERTLPEGALLICDAERPVAVAGVLGGADTQVTDATTDVLLESAYFDPATVRRTARALGLSTDSSYRFERGVDPTGQPWAAARAARLITTWAGGTLVPGMAEAHPNPAPPRTIPFRPARAARVLGAEVPPEEAERLLRALGFGVERGPDGTWTLAVPGFRPDVEREIDAIEEVARLWGFARIPRPARMAVPAAPPRPDRVRALREAARDRLAGLGFRELYTNSLLPADVARTFAHPSLTGAAGEAVVTANAINREMAALRPSLLPGLLATAAHNQNRDAGPLRLFEFGHVFLRGEDPNAPVPGYREREALALGLSGEVQPAGWDTPAREADFFDLKGLTLHLLAALGLEDVDEHPETESDALTDYRLTLTVGDERIGVIARVGPAAAERFGLRRPLYAAELDWTRTAALLAARPPRRYVPVPRFPAVDRDLAVVVDRTTAVGPLLRTVREAGRPLLRHVRVFDRYVGERIGPNQQSVAFALRFGADRTLTDEEVDAQMARIVDALERTHGAQRRS